MCFILYLLLCNKNKNNSSKCCRKDFTDDIDLTVFLTYNVVAVKVLR